MVFSRIPGSANVIFSVLLVTVDLALLSESFSSAVGAMAGRVSFSNGRNCCWEVGLR